MLLLTILAVPAAVAIVAGIALVCGLCLSAAASVMSVPRDESAENLLSALPGINCGACGYSGCEGYARAMAHEGARVGLCSPGGSDAALATAAMLGVESGEIAVIRASVRCGGCHDVSVRKLEYQGKRSCLAVTRFYGGDIMCDYGCLGYGDCRAGCIYGAISMRNGIAVIDRKRCTGCGMCQTICPRRLITMSPESRVPLVRCSSRDKGAAVRRICSRGCIGCAKCVKSCESGAIKVDNFLAVIDNDKCTACGACIAACPAKCID